MGARLHEARAVRVARGRRFAILVASDVYFRSFEPSLRVLQEMNPEDVPFQDELVRCTRSDPGIPMPQLDQQTPS